MRSGCSIIHSITADSFLEWKKLSREKERKRQRERQTDIIQNHMNMACTKQLLRSTFLLSLCLLANEQMAFAEDERDRLETWNEI